ncbi:mechanosensitive ion channel family protein [Alteromonas sediminis]|nr:mechanosensitive ion channel family protein [Alteromonas sediminis]
MKEFALWSTTSGSEAVKELLGQFSQSLGITANTDSPLYMTIVVGAIALASVTSLVVVRLVLSNHLTSWILRSKNNWDDSLQQRGFFKRVGHLIPALVISIGTFALIDPAHFLYAVLLKVSQLYMLIVGLWVVFAILNTVEDLYARSRMAKRASITGFLQIAKLTFSIVTLLLSISIIIDKSPILLLSGLTAVAAVLLLIFRDTILGFVAGIQIAANRMFNTGDWIEIPKFQVDGEILEIGLTNVKVQNWDKTISTLPTFALTNESVKNWRGMSDSGGRRIKRPLLIDIHSVKLCDAIMLEKFSKVRFISKYIELKKEDLAKYHKDNAIDEQDLLNSRQLSNIGTFRAYIEAYLQQHPKLNKDMTMMVRQLKPTEMGVPLEIYCFSAEKRWVEYEKIQSDMFDHLMAMLPVFELRAFQRDAYLQTVRPGHTP